MIIQHPGSDEPQITDRQTVLLQDSVAALAEQSSTCDLTRLDTMIQRLVIANPPSATRRHKHRNLDCKSKDGQCEFS